MMKAVVTSFLKVDTKDIALTVPGRRFDKA